MRMPSVRSHIQSVSLLAIVTVIALSIPGLLRAEIDNPSGTEILAGAPQVTYVRIERTSLDYIFATYCINTPDGYNLTWGQINANGSEAWHSSKDYPALNGCEVGIQFFANVGDGEHLFITATGRAGGSTTTSRFDLYPTPSHKLDQCTVQTDAFSPLIRDPRYRADTAAGIACAFVDPATNVPPPTATATSRPNVPTTTPSIGSPTPTPRKHSDIELYGLEVTQGIQNLKNDVVLIKDRSTYVRAHVRSLGTPIYGVRAELLGRRNGQELSSSPLHPYNAGGQIMVQPSPNRASRNDSFLFALPSSWLNGTVEFEVRLIDDPLICHDHTGQNDDCKAQVTFAASPNLDVQFVGLTWRGDNGSHTPKTEHYQTVARQLLGNFPIPKVNWIAPYSIEPVFFANQPRTSGDWQRLNDMLSINRLLDECSWGCNRYYLGLAIDPLFGVESVLGKSSDIPSNVASGYADLGVIPHEMGHAAGRLHTKCNNNEDGYDKNYPYEDGRISTETSGDGAFYGFDVTTRTIYSPDTTGDLMSYCYPRWPSDHTYTKIRDSLVLRYGTPTTIAGNATTIVSGQEMMVLNGILPAGQPAALNEMYKLTPSTDVTIPTSGSYLIRLEDAQGQPLADYAFDPTQPAEGGDRSFTIAIPWMDGTQRIVLLHGDTILATRDASAHEPTVTILSPIAENTKGITTITWSASDADGDTLTYAVQYSPNGGTTWQTLVSGWPNTTLDIPLDNLPATNNGIIRVLASDGLHTAQATTPAPLIIQNGPPVALIDPTIDGNTYIGSQAIVLNGHGYDKDDGGLVDPSLQWTSDLNGQLGQGETVVMDASTLSVGKHHVTLTVTDKDGQSSQSTVSIEVASPPPPGSARLIVDTNTRTFIVRQGATLPDTQPIFLRAIGDIDVTWSAVTDQPWLTLSKTSGTTPEDVNVLVNPSTLSPGTHTALVTITSTQDQGTSLAIPIRVVVESTGQSDIYLPILQR